MNILLKDVCIVDKRHRFNNQKKDLLIENGEIKKIDDDINLDVDQVIEGENLHVSIGWFDLRANFRDPGEEFKEDLISGLRAAKKGGFTGVAVMPDTFPAIDSKGGVEYILNRAKNSGVEVFPIGSVTKAAEGESLSEMYDMYQAGARGFSDNKKSIRESGLLQRALLYTKNIGSTLMHFPFDNKLVPGGQMNEGIESTQLGLRGIPAISEEMMVSRDLQLNAYAESKIHLGPLSSYNSLKMIAEARDSGQQITTEVALPNLLYSDTALHSFDSAYKVLPPLRSEEVRLKLIEALNKGWIDVISSDHSPEDEEHKKLEFEYANFGMASIEFFFPLLWEKLNKEVQLDELIERFTIGPRKVLNLNIPSIQEGEKANLTVFNPSGKTAIQRKLASSKAYNLPEEGSLHRGEVVTTILA